MCCKITITYIDDTGTTLQSVETVKTLLLLGRRISNNYTVNVTSDITIM
jgi:hypothetical protein